jgi:hypothetical protein
MKASALARWLAVLAEVGLVECRVPNEASTTEGVPRTDRKPDSERAVEPIGGPWVSCYGNYRPTSTPERDVTRLGLMCGPENGMTLLHSTITGAAGSAVEQHVIEAEQGECLRIFAVAEVPVTDLAVEVSGPHGARVASDHNGDRWPILNPDGPFCLLDGGRHTIRVRARQGRGSYALQIWRLAR